MSGGWTMFWEIIYFPETRGNKSITYIPELFLSFSFK